MNHSKRRSLRKVIEGHRRNLAVRRLPPAIAQGTRLVIRDLVRQEIAAHDRDLLWKIKASR